MEDKNKYLEPTDVKYNPKDIENAGELQDPLKLDIDDDELIKIIDKKLEDFSSFYDGKYHLWERRGKLETYLFGRQIDELDNEKKLKDYDARNLDNVLWEIEATTKPLAMSQLPDLLVTPGNESQEAYDIAKLLTQAVDTDVKKINNRQVLGMAFKHRKPYFVGIIKAVWNPELAGGLGDYEFINVHPNMIEFDHTATSPDVDKMSFVSHIIPTTPEKVLMQFPKAKQKFADELRRLGIRILDKDGKQDWKGLSTPIKIREIWFTEYEPAGEKEFRRIEGVMWKYRDCILDKKKNYHFDYEGEKQVFTYDNPRVESSKRALGLDEMQQSMVIGVFPPYVKEEQIYHNYFQSPRKPFYFMTYDQWGKQPLDESTDLEQNVKNQDALDSINKNVQIKLKNHGHHVWSKDSGLKSSDIERMDHNNPNEDYLVDGNIGEVHEFINGEQVTEPEFKEMDRIQNRMYSISGSTAVRGNIQSNVATTNQIARENNYTRADDMVDETINPAATWMAQWALQFIKLRYTQKHLKQILGAKGEIVFLKLHRNLVQDGMEVMIKASGTDKIKAQNNAQENARMQLTEPLSYYRDMGYEDAEDRTVMLLTFQKDPMTYMTQFIEDSASATPDLIAKLQALPVAPPQPIMTGQAGSATSPGGPQLPTAGATAQVPTQQPQVPQGSPRI